MGEGGRTADQVLDLDLVVAVLTLVVPHLDLGLDHHTPGIIDTNYCRLITSISHIEKSH